MAWFSIDLAVSACHVLKIASTDRAVGLTQEGKPCVMDELEGMNLVPAAALGCLIFDKPNRQACKQ